MEYKLYDVVLSRSGSTYKISRIGETEHMYWGRYLVDGKKTTSIDWPIDTNDIVGLDLQYYRDKKIQKLLDENS